MLQKNFETHACDGYSKSWWKVPIIGKAIMDLKTILQQNEVPFIPLFCKLSEVTWYIRLVQWKHSSHLAISYLDRNEWLSEMRADACGPRSQLLLQHCWLVVCREGPAYRTMQDLQANLGSSRPYFPLPTSLFLLFNFCIFINVETYKYDIIKAGKKWRPISSFFHYLLKTAKKSHGRNPCELTDIVCRRELTAVAVFTKACAQGWSLAGIQILDFRS